MDKIPIVTNGKFCAFTTKQSVLHLLFFVLGLLYTYLADCSGKSGRGGAFRALQRGYTHWSSGRLAKIEINFRHPLFCHVKCQMTPSMKKGVYKVYILLQRQDNLGAISVATCDCAAGYVKNINYSVVLTKSCCRKSASCTHVSALLHALASLSPFDFNNGHQCSYLSDEDAPEPVTSFLCKWNAPRKRKESNKTIAESVFEKHVYGRERKHNLKSLEDFNPLPESFRGKANDNLKIFLSKVCGQGLGVSVLKD